MNVENRLPTHYSGVLSDGINRRAGRDIRGKCRGPMKSQAVKADLLLLVAAVIWGFAFVAQRIGMDHVGPFTFNGVRFALGCAVLLPFIAWRGKSRRDSKPVDPPRSGKTVLLGGVFAGCLIFGGASFQQVGLLYTTAGKAGFITGLYVVIVPLLGLIWRQRAGKGQWFGAFLAAMGLYFLSVNEDFVLAFGDFLELVGACIWACHVLLIGRLSPRVDPYKLAFTQFAVCSLLSLATAFCVETVSLEALGQALWPILYGGALSVGVAYTLQVVAQQKAPPTHAAIILSSEAIFAALGGWIVLSEVLSMRGCAGCALMLAGMLISQLWTSYQRSKRSNASRK